MSSLASQLRSLHNEGFDKIAEQAFCDAVFDELEKLGYDAEMMKAAGLGTFLTGVGSKVKSLLPGARSAQKLEKLRAAQASLAQKGLRAKKRVVANIQTGVQTGRKSVKAPIQDYWSTAPGATRGERIFL